MTAPPTVVRTGTAAQRHSLIVDWLSRWWATLPEVDKAIITGAAFLTIPLVVAIGWVSLSYSGG